MHTLGKVLTWMVVIAALAAVVLTARALDVRTQWLAKVESLRTPNEENAKQLARQRAELRDLQADLARTRLGWDLHWLNVNTQVNPASGNLTVDLGTDDGLGVPQTPEAPVVYAFEPIGDGEYRYVGPFWATTIREAQASLTPAWRLRGNGPADWRSGDWRFRKLVPSPVSANFEKLQAELTLADERLGERLRNLEIQDQLIQVSQQHLKLRQDELLGFDNPPPTVPGAPIEWEVGLVAAIAQDEEARNRELAEVDRLRREVKRAHEQMQRLIAENQALVRSLPQPATAGSGAQASR